MSEEQEKGRQRQSGLLKATWEVYQQGAGEVNTYKRDRLEGKGERRKAKNETWKLVDIKGGEPIQRNRDKTKSLINNADVTERFISATQKR